MYVNLKKKYGQNFLIDKNILSKISNLINLQNKKVLEIGPGAGHLTDFILEKKPKTLILIEIDNELTKNLKLKYSKNKIVEIINIDFLKFDLMSKNKFDIIISNLPYNVASQILVKISTSIIKPKSMILMFQKEFADKLLETKLNSINSIIRCFYDIKKRFNVKKNSFFPVPKVESTILEFLELRTPLINELEILEFINFKREIFSKKRKTIKSILNKKYDLNLCNYNLNMRAEELSINNLIDIFRVFNS